MDTTSAHTLENKFPAQRKRQLRSLKGWGVGPWVEPLTHFTDNFALMFWCIRCLKKAKKW